MTCQSALSNIFRVSILIIIVTFVQDIHNYVPETNHISRVHSVAAVLYLQFVLHVMLFRPRYMFCIFTLAVIIIIIIIISFMQGIYTYIPETNYVPREYSVAAVLLLLFMVFISLVLVLNLLYFYISTFRSICAVPNVVVFWSSLTSCFPGIF